MNEARRRPLSLFRQPVLVGTVLIVLYGVARAIVVVREYIALAFFALVLAALLRILIDFLGRWMRRWVAVLLTLILFVGILGGLAVLVAPLVADQAVHLFHSLPSAINSALARLPSGHIADRVRAAAERSLGPLFAEAAPIALGATHALATFVLLVALAFFLAAAPDAYFQGVLVLVPQEHEATFTEWWHRTGEVLRKWVGGILVSMTIMGTLATVGLAIIGVQDWLLLGSLTFFGTFIPYLGAVASAVPALLVAWTQSPTTCLWVLLLYIGVHVVEGYVVSPFIMRRAVTLRPATLLVFQAMMLGLFGLPGVFIGTPLLACLKTTVLYLYVERRLGKVTDAPEAHPLH